MGEQGKKKGFTLSQKITALISLVLVLTFLTLGTISYITARDELDKTSKIILTNGVNMVLEVIKMKQEEVAAGIITKEEAQNDIKVFILGPMQEDGTRPGNDKINLGAHGYMFVLSTDGIEIAHPSIEGTNQWDAKDKSGKDYYVARNIIEAGLRGGDFSYYSWEHPYTMNVEKKIAYSVYDPEWEWVVSSSIYMSDYNKGAIQVVNTLLITFFITMIIGSILIVSVSRYMTQPIVKITDEMNHFIDGNGVYKFNHVTVNTKDEVGELSRSFNYMAEQLVSEMSERAATEEELQAMNEQLESLVEKRTEILSETLLIVEKQNEDLSDSLEQLSLAKDQLIESEKMAALGALVSGVAHEINTPLGNSITLGSYLDDLVISCNDEDLSEDTKENLSDIKDAVHMLNLNLVKAANLISSFKEVAVDQQHQVKTKFNVKIYIEKILTSLHHNFKNTNIDIVVNCDENIDVVSYPGAYSQLLTNLIMNSLIHGFGESSEGTITIDIHLNRDILNIDYFDNGKGISEENLSKVFDPFFTTKRHQGGSGLGMFIVYNIVTQKLHGLVELNSQVGKGVHFDIRIPVGDAKTADFLII